MESYCLSVRGRSQGILHQEKTVVPRNGPILTITSASPYSSGSQNIGFNRAALDHNGNRIAAGDGQGNVYVFDRHKNRYGFVCHLGHCISSIAFNPRQTTDLIVGSSDCIVSFIDSEACVVRNTFNIHKSCVSHISLDSTKQQAVTSSLDVAVMWDLRNLSILHTLKLKRNIDIIRAFFLPIKDYLVSAFKDGSVFLWDAKTLHLINQFNCHSEESTWLRAVDGSKDGLLIVCGGHKDQVLVWSVEYADFLHSISLSDYLTGVKQLAFVSSILVKDSVHVVSILTSEGKLHFFDVDFAEHIRELKEGDNKITACCELDGKMAVITSLGTLKIYDLELVLQDDKQPIAKLGFPELATLQAKKAHDKRKKGKKTPEVGSSPDLNLNRLHSILSMFGQYPSKYRQIIWSNLLQLPRNKEYVIYYKEANDANFPLCADIVDTSVRKATTRVLSMIKQWCPVMEVVEYLPLLTTPFVKHFRRNAQFCFELLVTYITSWCQNWFLYLPHVPFNVIYAIENILLYHDRPLFHHFVMHGIPADVYAFPLLRTSFCKVFDEEQWFQLWDNIFSHPPDYIIFIVVAFLIRSRGVLLNCKTDNDVNAFLSTHSTLAEVVVSQAHDLRSATPLCFDPEVVVGNFQPLPKNGYPAFSNFTVIKSDLQTLERQRALDEGVDFIKSRMKELEQKIWKGGSDRDKSALAELNLLELRRYHALLEDCVMQSASMKQVEELELIDTKVKRIQTIMRDFMNYKHMDNMEDDGAKMKFHFHYEERSIVGNRGGTFSNSASKPSEKLDSIATVWDVLGLRENLTKDDG